MKLYKGLSHICDMSEKEVLIETNDTGFISKGLLDFELQFKEPFHFVGEQEFILKEVANVHQYLFLLEKDGDIAKLFLVQSEYYLPDNDHSYDYKSKDIVDLGGIPWIRDNFIYDKQLILSDRESDTFKTHMYLQSRSYDIPDHFMSNRLVNLYDNTNRYELLLIYSENVDYLPIIWSDLVQDRKIQDDKWKQEKIHLRQRALDAIEIA